MKVYRAISWFVALTFYSLNVMANSSFKFVVLSNEISSLSGDEISLGTETPFKHEVTLDRSKNETGVVINININESLLLSNNVILKTFSLPLGIRLW